MRRGLAALAVLFLLAHLASLPPTLEDIDSINFALGVRHFDVATHQPHPPGYPLFIALGKMSTPVLRAIGVAAPEVRGLAVWSAIGGAALVLTLFGLWRALDGDRLRAAMAAVIAAATPLFWFTAVRPLSDVAGLSLTVAALALLVRALPVAWKAGTGWGSLPLGTRWMDRRPAVTDASGSPPSRRRPPATSLDGMPLSRNDARALLAGAALSGLSIGFRSQAALLTFPLLTLLLVAPRPGLDVRTRLSALAAAMIGIALWAVPLVAASGGPSAYLAALGSQAGEDFSGVVMLWTNRSVRVAAAAVLNTFVLPWGSAALAGVVLAAAASGAVLLVVRMPRQLLLLGVMFGPYALFHLLFQETATTRYALPLVLPVAYLVAFTFSQARPFASLLTTAALVFSSLWLAVPSARAYGRDPSPVFRALESMKSAAGSSPLVAMHRRIWTESRRARQWAGEPAGRILPAPRDYEWLQLTRAWREQDVPSAWFLADPRRTDLALFDPASLSRATYRWPFTKATYVGGTRPDEIDLLRITRPGWFLERGWAVTPEVAGITERDGWGPHRQPSVGWIRRRAGGTLLMIGGRHLGSATDPPVRLHVALDKRPLLEFDAAPGFFLRFHALEAGALAGPPGFGELSVRADVSGSSAVPRVAIEQFNLQGPDAVQVGYADGWFEPEYNVQTGRSWRWMSDRATLAVRSPPGRDVLLRIDGESPLRYYSRPARLTAAVGDRVIATLEPGGDFIEDIRVPAALLASGDSHITLTSDRMFIPGDREGTADRRRLALRIYSVAVFPR